MTVLLTAALAVSAAAAPSCSWDRPGHNPFVGDVVATVDRYTHIPKATRDKLKRRLATRDYDEIADIRRDSITGRATYAPDLRQMHFGANKVCETITREKWSDTALERGLVYCEDEHCLIVPTVCRNVSLITRIAPARGEDDGPKVAVITPDDTPLEPETGAGPVSSTTFTDGLTPGGSSPVSEPVTPLVTPPGPAPVVPFVPFLPLFPTDPLPGAGPLVPVLPVPTPPIPEPGTVALWLLGLVGVAAAVRRRRRSER